MRRVLIVAYTFPPVAGVGIERTLKHVTYLPRSGWEPVVIAPATPGYRLVDPSTLRRVPAGTEVHRAVSVEPAHLRRLVGRILRGRRATVGVMSDANPAPMRPRPPVTDARRLLDDAWRAYVQLAWVPDEQIGWAPGAITAGLAADAADPVDALYSSGPPWTSHLVAAAIQGRTGLPWVADFRDPWIGNAYAAPLPAPHRAASAWLERAIVHRAAACVFASTGVRDEYAARYPDRARRFVTIHNGYGVEDVDAARRAARPAGDGLLRLAFVGSLQGGAEARLLADGLERLLVIRPEVRDRLRVQLVGWLSPAAETVAGARLAALSPVVERTGQQPKEAALRMLAEADAALVLLADGPGRRHVPSAKLFDALGLDVPVLAVAPDGEVRRILRELAWGIGVDPTPAGLAEGVIRLFDAEKPSRPADPDRLFERSGLTRRLAALLDGVASPG